ncbi:geraniol 8-hydroxylase-like [Mangifera indica]|uniref:geraniol 8-hydroxylase-like n=1 Tax=Mangifera indica TaxID=29780 RepID=UPI001CFA8D3F|nr:geraniol 8-hydroxylase-like [Mangifera indica]
MDVIFSCVIWFLFTWLSIVALNTIFRGTKPASRKLPPGPNKLPIIGNLLALGEKPHRSTAELAQIHGSIISLQLGQLTTIVISSESIAKQVLLTHDSAFCNRFVPDAVLAHQHDVFSMVWLPVSTAWRTLRKISSSHIFITQKLDSSQDIRRKNVHQLLSYVEENCHAGKAIDIGRAAFSTSLNLISNTMFSVDLAANKSEFRELVWNIMVEAGKPNGADYFPVLKKIDPQGIKHRLTIQVGKMLELFDRVIDQRLKLREFPGYVKTNDMLETLLNIMEDKTEATNRDYIRHLFLDLFLAGTDTTSNTLEWAMAELLRSPEALSKARLELEQTIGKGNPVEESDILQLPYLQAIIKETLRLHPPAPFLIPRKSSIEMEINGFTIPKDAQVLVNAWAIGRNENIWDNPNAFLPERFLESNIDVKGRNFELIPFGGGRRMCPGLPLAIRMLHLMLGSLLHAFDWKLEDGNTPEEMDMEDKFGITLQKAKPLHAIPIACN